MTELPSVLCKIYRSPLRMEMYLFVDHQDDLAPVPETLLEIFGQPELVISVLISRERKLARVDSVDVLKALAEQGYYLQMPSQPDTYMAGLRQKNEKL